MNPTTLSEAIRAAIAPHSMLRHPFYQAWSMGQLPREALVRYARQYWHHVRAEPTYVSAVHSRCDDLQARQVLLGNLADEEMGPTNHPELWLRFAEGIGAPRAEVLAEEPRAETRALVDTMRALTSGDWRVGVAALYAYESQVPEVSRAKLEGLALHYGIRDERTVGFFSVHADLDRWHSETEARLLDEHGGPVREEAIAAGVEAAKALWKFLDGAYAAACA